MKQKKLITNLTLILSVSLCLLLLPFDLKAQETAVTETESSGSSATSEESAKEASEESAKKEGFDNDYTVKTSIEIGLRGRDVSGNENKYRSDLNYKAGVRLFDSSVYITSKEGTNNPFDSLMITGTGFGADPNGYARFSVEKMGWYSADGSIRRYNYFNNLLNLALGQHTRNTIHNIGDFDITIMPQSDFKFRFGYGFDTNNGPGTTTYDFDRDEFPILSESKSRADDVRGGVDGKLLGFAFSFTQGYRRFLDDTSYRIDVPQLGNNPNPRASWNTFSRTIPERGSTHYSRFSTHRSFGKWADFTGRFIYSQSKNRFDLIQSLSGLDRFGNRVLLDETVTSGDSERPNIIGDVGLSIFATEKFTLSNVFSVNSYRISGGNLAFEQLVRTNAGGTPLPTIFTRSMVYRYTNFRRYINTIEGNYDFSPRLSVYLGYRYTNRRVMLNALDTVLPAGTTSGGMDTVSNTTNSFLAGFKAQPIRKIWTMYVDFEHGQADNAFTRLSNYELTQFRFKNKIIPTDTFSLDLSFELKDNTNPAQTATTPPTSFDGKVKGRIFSSSFSWTPNMDVSVNGGYTYNYLNSEIPVIFPVAGVFGQGLSEYDLRSNYYFIDGWFRPHPRVSFFGAYRMSKDTGGGDVFVPASYFIGGNYPLTFQSPEVRGIFKIHKYFDFNVGYQYYDYKEKVVSAINQSYRAHLPYVSLRIYFGDVDR